MTSSPAGAPVSESRTIRDARTVIRELEDRLRIVHLSPAIALGPAARWYVRKARLALRQAERKLAEADDPRLDALKPLGPHLGRHGVRRVRMRCTRCWSEQLRFPGDEHGCWGCNAPMEPVPRLPKGAA